MNSYLNIVEKSLAKKKLIVESQDLSRQIEETENAIAALGKSKVSLSTQLEDTKRLADAEARDRASLLTKYKNMATDMDMEMNIQKAEQEKTNQDYTFRNMNIEIAHQDESINS